MPYFTSADVVPQEGKQKFAFSLLSKSISFVIMGGARGGGKSELLTMIPLMFADDPYYRGIFFRRQYDEIMGANGLWQKAEGMYPLFDGKENISAKIWKFPSGARQQFSHMFYENDKESHRGRGYSFVGFDEIDQFSKEQVTALMACLRSEANMNSFMVGTLNPNPDSWVLPLVEWYLDETGKPRDDRCGAIRWFIVKDGEFVFGDSEEYFQENYPEALWVTVPNTNEKLYVPPKTFTYIFFNVFDNPAMMRENPAYISELMNKPDHERDRELWGNWYSKPKSQALWQRQWVRGENGERVRLRRNVPTDTIKVRAVDTAHSTPSDKNPYPDYTAFSPRIEKDREGFYYLFGDYHTDVIDIKYKESDSPVYGKFRKTAGERDTLMIKQMGFDPMDCSIVLAKDTGAGASDHISTVARLAEQCIDVVVDQSYGNTPGKKLKDFLPFVKACQLGLVFIVEESFDPKSLQAFYKELESFDGERSTGLKKDDWPDSVSMAFNALQNRRSVIITSRFQPESETQLKNIIDDYSKITKL